MKDSLFLLLTALCASVIAWLFWHITGNNGFELLAVLAMTGLLADNVRLRRKLRK